MKFLMAGAKGQAKDLLGGFQYENHIAGITLFDDYSKDLGDSLYGKYPIINNLDSAEAYFREISPFFIAAIASPPKRKSVVDKLKKIGGTNFSFIGSESCVSRYTEISEEGVIIQMRCEISSGVRINRGVLLNVKNIIGHDVSIGEYTTLAPDVLVLGGASIGANCIISTGVTIMPGIKIGNNVKVWMNKVVDIDLPDNTNFI